MKLKMILLAACLMIVGRACGMEAFPSNESLLILKDSSFEVEKKFFAVHYDYTWNIQQDNDALNVEITKKPIPSSVGPNVYQLPTLHYAMKTMHNIKSGFSPSIYDIVEKDDAIKTIFTPLVRQYFLIETECMEQEDVSEVNKMQKQFQDELYEKAKTFTSFDAKAGDALLRNHTRFYVGAGIGLGLLTVCGFYLSYRQYQDPQFFSKIAQKATDWFGRAGSSDNNIPS